MWSLYRPEDFCRLLSGAFDRAVDLGLVAANPVDKVDAPAIGSSRDHQAVWTSDEIRAFLADVGASRSRRMVPLYGFAIATGARRGEILGLQWSDIDFAAKTATIRRTRIKADRVVTVSSPKTSSSYRTRPLPRMAEAFLMAQRELVEKERAELGVEEPEIAWVFVDRFGRPLDPDYVRQRFIRDVTRAPVRRVRFHDLRHTFATNALENGTQVKAVSQWLGHSNVQTTLSFYSHVLPALEADAADRVDAALFGEPELEQEPDEDGGETDVTRDVT